MRLREYLVRYVIFGSDLSRSATDKNRVRKRLGRREPRTEWKKPFSFFGVNIFLPNISTRASTANSGAKITSAIKMTFRKISGAVRENALPENPFKSYGTSTSATRGRCTTGDDTERDFKPKFRDVDRGSVQRD